MTVIARLVATVVYVGYAPLAPGTAGAAVAAMLYWILPESDAAMGLIALFILILSGVWASSRAEKIYGKDASKIVVDEFAGFFVAVLLLPKTLFVVVLGFFLFRFFDIVKPYPIRAAERLKGGLGVMADDILAGILTNVILRIIVLVLY